jgi:flavin reductase (DIM6/NTAB) family NADH-FMN oxidoreductase RutF
VVLVGSRNPDGTATLAPMSSAWWLGQSCMLGLGNSAQTTANLLRERQCVLNLAPSSLAGAVDRLALTTAAPAVPAHKAAIGYRYDSDKFATAGLTEQPGDIVTAPRVAECPIQLECEVAVAHPFGAPEPHATAFQVNVIRAHVEADLMVPGTHYVDPLRWDPLIMKFTEFFGGGDNVHPSRLADGWQMPPLQQLAELQ